MSVFADTIYHNGAIYTVDASRSWAEAVAIRDGKFIYVGSNQGVQSFRGPATEVVALGGKMAMPGLHDMHIHGVEGALKTLFECHLPYTASAQEIVQLVASYASTNHEREWIVGGAWVMQISADIHKSLLDAIVPERPVFLWDASHHNAWVNSKALELAGITCDTPDPAGGQFVRDEEGEISGLLLEHAATQLYRIIPPLPQEAYMEGIYWLAKMLNGLGVTSIKEAAANRQMLAAYKALDEAQALNLRVGTHLLWLTPFIYDPADMEALVRERQQYAGERVKVDFLKLFLDGVPVAKTAAMLEPYVGDDPASHDPYAMLLVDRETLQEVLIRFDGEGFTVKMHATGDASLRAALDAIEAARKANGYSGLGHEIAHAQTIHPDDLPRFKALEAVPDFCPILWHPSPNHELLKVPLLGRERAEASWPIRSLRDSGARAIAGTDWPAMVPNANNWPGIEAMITRQDPSGQTPGVLGNNQAIDLATALDIYTINGAHAARHAHLTGSIEVGKYADMIVLDRHLFEIPATEIGKTKVLLTILEGNVVFSTKQ